MARVAIIGAGASGLSMARYVREFGGEPVIFERGDAVGGIWRFDASAADAARPAYASLRTNTSRKVMGFAGAPFPDGPGDFPDRGEVEDYLAAYQARHALKDCVRFGATVQAIEPGPDGQWLLFCSEASGREVFDSVAVCSGQYKEPAIPSMYQEAQRSGVELLHSALYRTPGTFAGKRVLVAGVGNSGADIAVELCKAGANVAISAPSSTWVIPKHIDGVPYDHFLTNLAIREPFKIGQGIFEGMIRREYERRGVDLSRYRSLLGRAPLDFSRSRMTVNDDLPKLASAGELQVLSKGLGFEGRAFIDVDGRRFECDVVITATGFRHHFPFLPQACQPTNGGTLALYKHVFHPTVPGLCFLGMCGIVGAIFPAVELQARWAASCFTRRSVLPGGGQMVDAVQTHNAMAAMYQMRAARVLQIDYMETLAWELGLGTSSKRKALINRSDDCPVVADMYLN